MNSEKSLARTLLGSFISWHFKSRRLEDRIRELCVKAVVTTDPSELRPILDELSAALHLQVERLRQQASQKTVPLERRFSRI